MESNGKMLVDPKVTVVSTLCRSARSFCLNFSDRFAVELDAVARNEGVGGLKMTLPLPRWWVLDVRNGGSRGDNPRRR